MSCDEFRDNRHVRVVVQRVQRAAVKVDAGSCRGL